MPVKAVYLTIDDAPSIHMHKKVDFLIDYKIPAIFYCRGEFIEKNMNQVIYAINNGFLIGNHSYSHPYFSEIVLDRCKEEILKTEVLIDLCYQKANTIRTAKFIRLPFGDRGAGPSAREAETDLEKDKVFKIQLFLKEQKFVKINFQNNCKKFAFYNYIDSFWHWDTYDYKSKLINNSEEYMKNLIQFQKNSLIEESIMLLHDFDLNHHLFELTMKFLLKKNISFLPIKI